VNLFYVMNLIDNQEPIEWSWTPVNAGGQFLARKLGLMPSSMSPSCRKRVRINSMSEGAALE
jgi:hypothetical protein